MSFIPPGCYRGGIFFGAKRSKEKREDPDEMKSKTGSVKNKAGFMIKSDSCHSFNPCNHFNPHSP